MYVDSSIYNQVIVSLFIFGSTSHGALWSLQQFVNVEGHVCWPKMALNKLTIVMGGLYKYARLHDMFDNKLILDVKLRFIATFTVESKEILNQHDPKRFLCDLSLTYT